MPELKPCRCGNEQPEVHAEPLVAVGKWFVECSNCEVRSPSGSSPAAAIGIWNRQATELARCRFCGGGGHINAARTNPPAYYVLCLACHAIGPTCIGISVAAHRWNAIGTWEAPHE